MATISPPDAEVALRTFPRRWRALLGRFDPDDPDAEALLRHRGTAGVSALDCVGRAGAALEVGARDLRATVTHDRPVLEGSGNADGAVSLHAALDRIDRAAPALAAAVHAVSSKDLDRPAERGGATVTVRTLIADVVDEVAQLLREAERALADARGRPR